MTCEKVLDLMCYMVLPIQDGGKSQEEPSKIKPKFRKGTVQVLFLFCNMALGPKAGKFFTIPDEIILCDLRDLTNCTKS